MEHRVRDPRILSLIRRWPKAGVLDEGKLQLRGGAYLIRYIDDFVVCFQHKSDAKRFEQVLAKRLDRFSLALEPSKTQLLEFGRFAQSKIRKPKTVNFLGFTHYLTRNRKGNFKLGHRTEKSRLRRAITHIQALQRQIRHESLSWQ